MKALNQTFAALADPTRRAILARLARGDATVGELSAPFTISAPSISRHLRVLESAALIVREREGQHRRCRLIAGQLQPAHDWLGEYSRFWGDALERLDKHLKQDQPNSKQENKESDNEHDSGTDEECQCCR